MSDLVNKSVAVSNTVLLATTTAANAIPFNVAFWDAPPPLAPFWDAANPTRLTASEKGRYLVTGSAIFFTAHPVTKYYGGIQIVKRPAGVVGLPIDGDAQSGVFATADYKSLTFSVTGIVELDVGEYVELTQNATFLNGTTAVAGQIDNTARRSPVLQMVCLETL